MRWRPALAVAGLVLMASPVAAQAPKDAGAPPAAASACASCHGTAGQGDAAGGVPRLAGMPAAYLSAQLLAYRSGRRSDPVMGQLAVQLDAADIPPLAAYFASRPAVDRPGSGASPAGAASASASAPAASAALADLGVGEALARRGNWKNGVPACAQCHAPDGLGVGDSFPPIAGQPALYLANQLQAWKARRRDTDPMGLMRGVASRLSAAEIDAVAAWYAALPAAAAAPPPAVKAPARASKPDRRTRPSRPAERRRAPS